MGDQALSLCSADWRQGHLPVSSTHECSGAANCARPVPFPPLTQDLQPALRPLPGYEDAMSVGTGHAGRTPLPTGDDLMDPTPKLTSIFEDPAPEAQASRTPPYLV
jgi:hypothetical protein